MAKKDDDLGSYRRWRRSLEGAVYAAMEQRSMNRQIFRQLDEATERYIAVTKVGGEREMSFDGLLADPECFGQPPEISTLEAFIYMVAYVDACTNAGVEPAPFQDMRVYVDGEGLVHKAWLC